MIMKVINYSVRGLIIIIGIFMLFFFSPANPNIDMTFVRLMGAIMTLFGTYRIVIYYYEQKKYNFRIEEEESDEENNIEK